MAPQILRLYHRSELIWRLFIVLRLLNYAEGWFFLRAAYIIVLWSSIPLHIYNWHCSRGLRFIYKSSLSERNLVSQRNLLILQICHRKWFVWILSFLLLYRNHGTLIIDLNHHGWLWNPLLAFLWQILNQILVKKTLLIRLHRRHYSRFAAILTLIFTHQPLLVTFWVPT